VFAYITFYGKVDLLIKRIMIILINIIYAIKIFFYTNCYKVNITTFLQKDRIIFCHSNSLPYAKPILYKK